MRETNKNKIKLQNLFHEFLYMKIDKTVDLLMLKNTMRDIQQLMNEIYVDEVMIYLNGVNDNE